MLNDTLKLRKATSADLDDLATIACTAMPADPQWDYRFPHRKEYPKDNYKCTRELYKKMLKEEGVVIDVITVDIKQGDKQIQKPIALAVWELQYEKSNSLLSVASCDDRRDADPKRMEAFKKAGAKARKEYFDDIYEDRQIHLRVLATHPDWQRRGAATQLCDWGMDLADENRIPVTVLSSPMGGKLYTHLGFETLGHFTVQVEGEEEKLSIGVMIKKYEKDDCEKEL